MEASAALTAATARTRSWPGARLINGNWKPLYTAIKMRTESAFTEDYLDRGVGVFEYLKARFPDRPTDYLGWQEAHLRRCCEQRVKAGTAYRGHAPNGATAYYRVSEREEEAA